MRRAVIVLAAVFVLVCGSVGAVLYRLIADRKVSVDALAGATGAVIALTGVAAAVATAGAAWAALRAAQESTTTARRATEALGLAMQPTLRVALNGPPPYVRKWHAEHGEAVPPTMLHVENTSRWAHAADIRVQVVAADGRKGEKLIDLLPPGDEVEWTFEHARARRLQQHDPDRRSRFEEVDEIVTTYNDERRLLRWRMVTHQTHLLDGTGQELPEGERTTHTVERVVEIDDRSDPRR